MPRHTPDDLAERPGETAAERMARLYPHEPYVGHQEAERKRAARRRAERPDTARLLRAPRARPLDT